MPTYTFLGALAPPPNGILSGAKFTLRPSLALSFIGSDTARHWRSVTLICGALEEHLLTYLLTHL